MEKKIDNLLQDLELDANDRFGKLDVHFMASVKEDFGKDLNLVSVHTMPNVNITRLGESKFLTLIMAEPDAPRRSNPVAKGSQFKHKWTFFVYIFC